MLQLNARVFSEIESPFVILLACEQEMETLFVNEFSNTSLRVLKPGDEKAISILSTWSSCELDRNHSWYFGCSDSRLSSSSYLDTMMNLFTLTKGDFYFNLKVRNGSSYTFFVAVVVVVAFFGTICREKSQGVLAVAAYTRGSAQNRYLFQPSGI